LFFEQTSQVSNVEIIDMKVLLFDFGYYSTPHLETEGDIIQQHLDQGDEVLRLVCKSSMPICTNNRNHDLNICAECVCHRKALMNLITPKVQEKPIFKLTAQDKLAIGRFNFLGNRLAELKSLTFGEFDIGLAVASVVVDATKNPDPDLGPILTQVNDWIGVTLAAYLSTLNMLTSERPDRVYVINGRWCYTRAVLRACQARGVPCFCHDRGGDLGRYLLVESRLLHEIAGHTAAIEKCWGLANPADREVIGGEFFKGKAKGIERQWFSFVEGQKQGELPQDWSDSRRNIAVFMTSEFEFAAIGPEYNYRFYKDQNDALAQILTSLEEFDAPIHLNVRCHPNMKGIRNPNIDWLRNLRSPKATIIDPESPVSSYHLLLKCDKVLTFGSTMGIEAVYWKKASILGGPSLYQNLGATYNPTTHEELVEMLLADLPPKSREGALKYGYYELAKGVRHEYYQPETPFRGTFKHRSFVQDAPWHLRWVAKMARQRWVWNLSWRISRLHRRYLRFRLGLPWNGVPSAPPRSIDDD
jgi:hypothetical protein